MPEPVVFKTEDDYPKPVAPFPYTMRTISVMEHSHGIAWTAALLRNGRRVGLIEQMGDGGADRVIIQADDWRRHWEESIVASFPDDGEEGACFYLLCTEEEA